MKTRLGKDIVNLVRGKVFFDEPLSRHTSFRIGGPAEVWVEPEDLEDLIEVVKYSSTNGIPIFVIGGGNNLLVRDEGIRGIIINLSSNYFKRIDPDGDRGLRAFGGANLAELVEVAQKFGLGGLEFMVGIPGTVGGAVMMNAGCYDKSIGELVWEVRALDREGKVVSLSKEGLNFGYRSSSLGGYIVLEVYLRLEKKAGVEIDKEMGRFREMKAHLDGLDLPNAGSIFKNPDGVAPSSGRLIELSGLKGISFGGAQVWPRHCNFIVNRGDATAKDVLTLIAQIRDKVRSDHGLDLELEIKII